MTAPLGRREMASSRARVAGIDPVEPAAMTGASEEISARRAASRRSTMARLAMALTRFTSRRREG